MVSIIILSYNTRELLLKCLTSIFEVIKNERIEVIVLDNASSDNSSEMIKKYFPQVNLIENKDNIGFARGVNLASKQASGEYLLFLNSDTVLTNDVVGEMIAYMEGTTRIGVVGGRLIQKNSSSLSYGEFPGIRSVFMDLFLRRDQKNRFTTPTKVDWVSGGFMLISKKIFEEVNGFDEDYFMYIEDIDLCYRLSKKGYQILYFPNASVSHVGQGSSNRTFAIINISRGLILYFKKHHSVWKMSMVKIMILIKAVFLIILGNILKNTYMTDTYKKVYKAVV